MSLLWRALKGKAEGQVTADAFIGSKLGPVITDTF